MVYGDHNKKITMDDSNFKIKVMGSNDRM